MIDISALRSAIELLYSDVMDVTIPQTTVVNGITRTYLPDEPQMKGIPCHIGWPNGTQDDTNGTHTVDQNQIVVSCSPSLIIPTGSRIDIRRHDGFGNVYAILRGTTDRSSGVSGASSVGANHQELPVSLESVS